MAKIPLAWAQLTREKMRLVIALAGIGFADLLMFMQFGFRDALFESSVSFHSQLQGDIFITSTQSTALIAMKSFPQRRLYQALSFNSVTAISPVYLGFGLWKNPAPNQSNTRQLMVIGFDPTRPIFDMPEIQNNLDKIKMSDVVLFDRASRPEFGPVAEYFDGGKTVETEVDNRRVKVEGLFTLGASFGADGNIVTSDLNFLRIFATRRTKGLIDIGIVYLQPGTDVKAVVEKMRATLPSDVRIDSKEEFVAFEKKYWEEGTAIGFIFTLGAAMGFIVGIVIVYQILYTDVNDHLPEYATLKAMGYKDFYFLGVVFQEALILAILGYLPGFGVSVVLYNLGRSATSLPMYMTVGKAVTVFVMTVFMCCLSGAIAVRKLQAADPADIF
ncbi:FtsX-like permease family protein [Tychonema sp. LEGE 07199]|uniref:ABC transporter permease DevC n=1 Tax=unclassified Tychonema TaxID=2642144 RepID=UPI00187EB077|nr:MULTISPECIES: ABC transporter permease DevC [unclassified Tychonema]MBE9123163.1 FtsX-like permease family protein [Tychonema sp. LEGE 07199]MBE9132930.1 FtsX-like permease family protein [Tychonema sp. LEGE 07196]